MASVKPTMSGTIMERRDQVLIGRLLLAAEAASTLCIRWWSTNGPFLSERGMAVILDGHPDPANRPAWPDYKSTPTIAHDELLRALVVACLVTLGRDTPRGNRMRVALAGLGFT